MAEVMAEARIGASALAFGPASDLPLLAAGSAPGSSNPVIAFFRAAALDPELLHLVARVPTPSPFCRMSWSRPTEATYQSDSFPAGLVAGGLENGVVAIWDPRRLLPAQSRDLNDSIIEDFFVNKDELQFHSISENTLGLGSDGIDWDLHHEIIEQIESRSRSRSRWKAPLNIIEDYLVVKDFHETSQHGNVTPKSDPHNRQIESRSRWKAPLNIIEDYFVVKDFHETSQHGNVTPKSDPHNSSSVLSSKEEGNGVWQHPFKVIDDYCTSKSSCTAMDDCSVALLRCNSGPVRGLAFSPVNPHILAAGADQGRILVWDVKNPSKRSIPTFWCKEAAATDNAEVTCISWNCFDPNIILSASNCGITMWDVGMKCPLIRKLQAKRSLIQWSPFDKNVFVAASEDYGDIHAMQIWDTRCMDLPVQKIKANTQGVNALSWSTFDEDIVLACTKDSKLLMANVKRGEVFSDVETPAACLDIQWSAHDNHHFAVASPEKIAMYRSSVVS
ncbi:unnamed protein product [Urochloa humidicola]